MKHSANSDIVAPFAYLFLLLMQDWPREDVVRAVIQALTNVEIKRHEVSQAYDDLDI